MGKSSARCALRWHSWAPAPEDSDGHKRIACRRCGTVEIAPDPLVTVRGGWLYHWPK